MKRRHSFESGRLPGDTHGIAGNSRYLGIHIGSMLDHKVEKCGVGRSCTATTAAAVRVHIGGKQERGRSHADDVWIGAFVKQYTNHFHIVVHDSAKQGRGSGTEKRIAETSALIAGPTHAQLRIRIDAGCQQGIDDLHTRNRRTASAGSCSYARATATAGTGLTAPATRASTAGRTLTCASRTCGTSASRGLTRRNRSGTSATGAAPTTGASSASTKAGSSGSSNYFFINGDVKRRASVHVPGMGIGAVIEQELGDIVMTVVEGDH